MKNRQFVILFIGLLVASVAADAHCSTSVFGCDKCVDLHSSYLQSGTLQSCTRC